MDDETTEVVEALEALLEEIASLRQLSRGCREHMRWMQNALFILSRYLSKLGPYDNFQSLTWAIPDGTPIRGWDVEGERERLGHEAYQRDLGRAEGILESAIDQLRTVGLAKLREELGVQRPTGAVKVFISHGKESPALDRVERYVRALGLDPVIVRRTPSEGMAVDDLVEKRLGECRCAIILATKDDEFDGKWHPRQNVIHEIGLAQEKLDNKVIYLKEEGADFPSNVSPKVWENFTQDDLAPAFEKIAKELRAFGLI